MTRPFNLFRVLTVAAASATLLAACGGGDDDDLDDRLDIADPKVRFVHALPGGPAVTLQRNGQNEAMATNVNYKFGSQYYDVSNQTVTFSLRTASGNTELATAILNPSQGDRYTVLALPTTAPGAGAELFTIADPYNKSLTNNNARLRFFNASPNAQAFDVYITAVGANLATTQPNLTNIAYKRALPLSGNDSFELRGGNYQFRLTPAGSKTPYFSAPVTVPENGDWLLVTLPDDATPTASNAVRILRVRSDGALVATDEILTQ